MSFKQLLRAVRELPSSHYPYVQKLEYNIVEGYKICSSCNNNKNNKNKNNGNSRHKYVINGNSNDNSNSNNADNIRLCRGPERCKETAGKVLKLLQRLQRLDPEDVKLFHRKAKSIVEET